LPWDENPEKRYKKARVNGRIIETREGNLYRGRLVPRNIEGGGEKRGYS